MIHNSIVREVSLPSFLAVLYSLQVAYFINFLFILPVFFCLLIFLNLLCLGSPFRRLQVRSSRCFLCLSPVGKVGSVCCVGFLVEGTGACVLMGEAGFCLSGGQHCIRWCVWDVCELIMILGSLSANGWGCVPVLLVVWHGTSSTGACWPLVELGLSIEMVVSGRALANWYFVGLGGLSCGPTSWTRLSHLQGSGLTPGQSTKTLSATQLACILGQGCRHIHCALCMSPVCPSSERSRHRHDLG